MTNVDMSKAETAAKMVSGEEADEIALAIIEAAKPLIPDQVPGQERGRYLAHLIARAAGIAGSKSILDGLQIEGKEQADSAYIAAASFALGADKLSNDAKKTAKRYPSCLPMASLVGVMRNGWLNHTNDSLDEQGES